MEANRTLVAEPNIPDSTSTTMSGTRHIARLTSAALQATVMVALKHDWSDEVQYTIDEPHQGNSTLLLVLDQWSHLLNTAERPYCIIPSGAFMGHILALPVYTAAGLWVGTIWALDADQREWTIRDQTLLQDAAEALRADFSLQASQAALHQLQLEKTIILNSIRDMYVVVDRQWNIVEINPRILQITGLTYSQIVGHQLWTLLPATVSSVSYQRLHAAMHLGETVTFEEFVAPAMMWCLVNAIPTAEGLAMYVQDITLLRQTQHELQVAEGWLHVFFSQSLDGCVLLMFDPPVAWTDAAHKDALLDEVFAHNYVAQVNQSLLDQYGFTREQFSMLTLNDWYADNLARGKALIRTLLDRGTGHFEMFQQRVDGTIFWLEGSCVCLYDHAGRIEGFFAVQRDKTQSRHEAAARQFLLEASTTLANLVEYQETLQRICALAVAHIAEWCVVTLRDENGTISSIATAYQNASRSPVLRELHQPTLSNQILLAGASEVLRTDKTIFLPELTPATLAVLNDPSLVALPDALSLRSMIIVPWHMAAQVRGTLALVSVNLSRRYTQQDVALVEDLAHRIDQALEKDALSKQSQHAFQTLNETLAVLNTILATAPIGFSFHDINRRYVLINEALARINNRSIADHIGKTYYDVMSSQEALWADSMMAQVIETGEPQINLEIDEDSIRPNNLHRHWLVSLYPVRSHPDTLIGVGTLVVEVTHLKQLEAQFIHSQKMESIGRLAGGIAHDFNNLLTAILGSAQLALMHVAPDTAIHADLLDIEHAGRRAADLTQQLLSFARKQVIDVQVLNPNRLIDDVKKLLQRVLGENIQLVTVLADDIGFIRADASQISQVLLNMAVNGRDAMPYGGVLTIETVRVEADTLEPGVQSELPDCPCVLIIVRDTGMGMTAEIVEHIFEPFFTTKPPGEGTGLGLATGYGIIKQHGGTIVVASQPQHGTTFHIYLPSVAETSVPEPLFVVPAVVAAGNETILVVEDEPAVRSIVVRTLQNIGYRVLEAANGVEALALLATQPEITIDLLFTDLVMPRMNGRILAARLRERYPAIRTIFASGYADPVFNISETAAEITFLPKPFTPAILAALIRETLDKP